MKFSSRRLREIAADVMARRFSISFKRAPGVLTKQRVMVYTRSVQSEVKEIERLLKTTRPKLNRAARRYLARRHRWLETA